MALPVGGKFGRDVTVITVTFNSAAVIATLLATVPDHVRVILVDNDSNDDTVAIARRWPNVTVLALTSNSGFGAACNAGAALCDANYVFFVNPDAWLGPGCIETLAAAAANTPEPAAFNPRFLDQDLNLSLRGPSRFLGRARGERVATPGSTCCMAQRCSCAARTSSGWAVLTRRSSYISRMTICPCDCSTMAFRCVTSTTHWCITAAVGRRRLRRPSRALRTIIGRSAHSMLPKSTGFRCAACHSSAS